MKNRPHDIENPAALNLGGGFRIGYSLSTLLLHSFFLVTASLGADQSVCARVKIEIQQEVTLERQAFDAHMRINNGLTQISLENVKVDVSFSDKDGNTVRASSNPNDTSALFFIRLSSMENIGGVDGTGRVQDRWIGSDQVNIFQRSRERYSLIDYESLMDLLKVERMADLKEVYRGWVEESLGKEELGRQSRWTESIAVGSKAFVEDTKERLGIKAMGREVIGGDGDYELREAESSYEALFAPENSDLSSKNAYYWDLFH